VGAVLRAKSRKPSRRSHSPGEARPDRLTSAPAIGKLPLDLRLQAHTVSDGDDTRWPMSIESRCAGASNGRPLRAFASVHTGKPCDDCAAGRSTASHVRPAGEVISGPRRTRGGSQSNTTTSRATSGRHPGSGQIAGNQFGDGTSRRGDCSGTRAEAAYTAADRA